jgi:superfamily II DNA or RNA helicase
VPLHPYQLGDCLRIRDERWRVVRTDLVDDQPTVDVVGCDASNAGSRAVFLIGVERVARVPASHTPRVVRPARWRAIARRRLSEVTPRFDSLRAAAAADIRLLPFQLEPALAATHGIGCRLLIADEVGLGKTIQAGLVIAETLARTRDGHALVVAPAALRPQWSDELERRFHLVVAPLDAAAVSRTVRALGSGVNPWAACPVVVVSIDYVKRVEVLRALEALVWDVVVFDEAHQLTGLSDRAAAAHRIAARARMLVCLTATPHSGDAAAFARLTALGQLSDSAAPLLLFRRSRHDVGMPGRRRTRWLSVHSTPAEVLMHQRLLDYARLVCRQRRTGFPSARLAMSILLKRGCSSAASLARSLERRLTLLAASTDDAVGDQPGLPFDAADDEEPLAVLAVPGLSDRRLEEAMLVALLDAARSAARDERKLDALCRLLRRIPEPAIVFTEYRDTLTHVAGVLSGCRLALVHGGLTTSERRTALGDFTGGRADILLATDAASEGLNLQQRCRRVINIELPWTPLRLEQRIGRVDRIGQQRIVHATHLIARGTIEQEIVARHLTRLATAHAALSQAVSHVEDDIVAAITSTPSNIPPPPPGAHGSAPIVVADLATAAAAEVDALTFSRRLSADRPQDADGRPVITRVRRGGDPSRLWAVRLLFADLDSCVHWTTIVGISMRGGDRHAASLRRLLEVTGSDILEEVGGSLGISILGDARRFAIAGSAREREILAALTAAREQITPSTRGLFDHRRDRAASVQADILAAAARQCERRLHQLSSVLSLRLSRTELAFAVLLE